MTHHGMFTFAYCTRQATWEKQKPKKVALDEDYRQNYDKDKLIKIRLPHLTHKVQFKHIRLHNDDI